MADMAITQARVSAQLLALRQMLGTEEKPLAMEEAARRVGVGHRQWQRWEAGESLPYPKNLSKIVDAFPAEVGSLDYFDDGNTAKPVDRLTLLERELAEVKALVRELAARGAPPMTTAVEASRAATAAAVASLDAAATAQPESPTHAPADATEEGPQPVAPKKRQAQGKRGA